MPMAYRQKGGFNVAREESLNALGSVRILQTDGSIE